ncbi:MAG: hypothetical protein ACR2NF_07820, partial [Pirellulales bacterium]
PISLHREQCLTCLNLQVHLFQADQYKEQTLGFSVTDDEVVQECRNGMVHVNKAKQRLQSAEVLNCLGIDKLQKWANELEVFFQTETASIHRGYMRTRNTDGVVRS